MILTFHMPPLGRGYSRGDSMIWDFVGRLPLSVRNYVVSIKGGPKL